MFFILGFHERSLTHGTHPTNPWWSQIAPKMNSIPTGVLGEGPASYGSLGFRDEDPGSPRAPEGSQLSMGSRVPMGDPGFVNLPWHPKSPNFGSVLFVRKNVPARKPAHSCTNSSYSCEKTLLSGSLHTVVRIMMKNLFFQQSSLDQMTYQDI